VSVPGGQIHQTALPFCLYSSSSASGYLIRVAEQLNFRKAAENLFLSQPAVTQQIKAICACSTARVGGYPYASRGSSTRLRQKGVSAIDRLRNRQQMRRRCGVCVLVWREDWSLMSAAAVVDWIGNRLGAGDFDEDFAKEELVEDVAAKHVE
jgi:Bacterial regulatory helix-turn-helix protein, lysR family